MPRFEASNFLFQNDTYYSVSSEFMHIVDNFRLVSIRNLFFLSKFLITAIVHLDRLYVFLGVKYKTKLLNLFKIKSRRIKLIEISQSSNKIVIFTSKQEVYLYYFNFGYINWKKNYKSIAYLKKIEFFEENKKEDIILSANFDLEEFFLLFSYQSGKIKIFNLKKKSFFNLILKIIFEKILLHINTFRLKKIFGKTAQRIFIEYDFYEKKIFLRKNFFFFQQNFFFFQLENVIFFKCYCHGKKIDNVKILNSYLPITTIGQKILTRYHGSFFWLKFNPKKLYNCTIDFFSKKILQKQTKELQSFFLSGGYINFTLILTADLNSCIFLKPISENHKIISSYTVEIYNLEKIYDIKFSKSENSVIVAGKNYHLILYKGKKFYLMGHFYFKNFIFFKIEIKGNLLLACSVTGELVCWKLSTFEILTWLCVSKKSTSMFCLLKFSNYKEFILLKEGNCRLKLWEIFLNSHNQLKIKLTKTKKTKKKISLISVHKNKNIFGVVLKNKEIFIWKKFHKNPYLVITRFKRSIWSLNFSTIYYFLATGTSDGHICVFNYLTGHYLKKIKSYNTPVTNCLFHYNNSDLYSSDFSGKIKIWKMDINLCITVIAKNKNCIWSLDLNEMKYQTELASGCIKGGIFFTKEIDPKSLCKKKNYTKFLNLQTLLYSKFSFQKCFFTLKYLLNFQDSVLLFDFLNFIFTKLSPQFECILKLFIYKISLCELVFFFKSVVLWNLDEKRFYISQRVLKVILIFGNTYHLKNINHWILTALTSSTYHINRLVRDYRVFHLLY